LFDDQLLTMRDFPDYSITEFFLAALCFAAAVSAFIYGGHQLAISEPYSAIEWFGGGLALLAGCADPIKYCVDCVTFPFSIGEPAGRDTPITLVAGYIGMIIWLAGIAYSWLAR
jgi:hypothetical protein